MISDVLHDAVEKIEECLKTGDGWHAAFEWEISIVKTLMTALQLVLASEDKMEDDAVVANVNQVRRAIGELDIKEVNAAIASWKTPKKGNDRD